LNERKNKKGENMKKLFGFLKEEDGVTAIEYGLIAALIAVAIITAVTAIGTSLTGTFNKVSAKLG
jgi:pilus assembly protein Flp/PilA